MILKFIDRYDKNKDELRAKFSKECVRNYKTIVEYVIETITTKESDDSEPDPARITEINDGDYQGTLVYIIGAKGYQPSVYWSVYVGYGSCSGCDTLEAISGYGDEPPTEAQINDYMSLALHIVQGIKEI